MAMAFRKVRTGRPGPVSLDLPSDVLQGAVEGDDVRWVSNYYTDAPPLGHPDQVKRAVELLLHAERPMLIVGKGVRWSEPAVPSPPGASRPPGAGRPTMSACVTS